MGKKKTLLFRNERDTPPWFAGEAMIHVRGPKRKPSLDDRKSIELFSIIELRKYLKIMEAAPDAPPEYIELTKSIIEERVSRRKKRSWS